MRLHIFVDESSVEVFGQDGQVAMTALTFVDPQADGIAIYADHGSMKIHRLEIYALSSIWPQS
ncbi:MAG: GH32 C-terminal domain-containing protein [Chloroflexi bacterium]|nr:GH32 C-terminal domain-containing protein [Chloroflexota bacterium]